MRIQGLGWITPLGRDVQPVWEAVRAGATPESAWLPNPFLDRTFPIYRVDPLIVADVARLPRLRRSSLISHFAVAAAQDAVRDAGCDLTTDHRLAVVFAATNGGVIYTRRFYGDISKNGTHAGSPLLFPETVYNAPASHIAVTLGVTGITTTLVNDATVGVDAISAAQDLLDAGACDRCLVVAAEEVDWAICEAYAAWKLPACQAPAVPFAETGAVFSEGAAAVLLGKTGSGIEIDQIFEGATFRSLTEARGLLSEYAAAVDCGLTISSASGTRFDLAEPELLAGKRITPKASLGEAFAASTLAQIICGALALRNGAEGERAFVPVVGFHGQAAALSLRVVTDSPRSS